MTCEAFSVRRFILFFFKSQDRFPFCLDPYAETPAYARAQARPGATELLGEIGRPKLRAPPVVLWL